MNNNGEFNATFESLDANFNLGSGGREEFYNPSFGSTTEIQIPGPPGPPGDKGDSAYEIAVANGFKGTEAEWLNSLKATDVHYTHNQSTASDTWVVKHNLGKIPAVTVVDSAGTEVIGDITHNDVNTTTISFTSAFSGKAYFN